MSTNQSMTTEQQAAIRDLLGYYGEQGGMTPGSFTLALIRCFETADVGNTRRLAGAFPAMGYAVTIIEQHGTDGLRDALVTEV